MIAFPAEALAQSLTIGVSNTLRYVSTNPREGFQTCAYWAGKGLPSENICGQGRGDYSSSCIPVSASFSGPSTRVVIGLTLYCTNSRYHTFRWAITSGRHDRIFLGTGAASGSVVLAQGKFTPSESGGSVHYERITCKVSNLPQNFYIYIWRMYASYGNVHIYNSVDVKIYSRSGALSWENCDVYVVDENLNWQKSDKHIMYRYPDRHKEWKTIT